MKVFISADIEGVTGVVHADEVTTGTPAWERARRWMTDDVLAAVAGAREAGADEIALVDGHGDMRNILIDDLPDDVVAHRGPASGRTMCQVEGLDASFDCVVLVGHHAMAGSPGILSHTWHGGVVAQMRLDGRPIGEPTIVAAVAGHHGVPVVLATGDQVLAAEAIDGVPGIATVVVKEATGRQNARCRPPSWTSHAIRRATADAVAGRSAVRPLVLGASVDVEIDVYSVRQADRIARFLPSEVERLGPVTIGVSRADPVESFRWAWLCVELADMEPGAWNR